MKKKKILVLALTSLYLSMTGCGGEKAKINENPNQGVKTLENGCDTSSEKCLGFAIDYPVSGLNFDCSSLNQKHFATRFEGNVAIGGCPLNDKVTFYIQGETSSKKIELGTVDLKNITPRKISDRLIQIGLQDLAQGVTGNPIQALNTSDPTYQTMVNISRIFQAIGVQQQSNVAGDVQFIQLTRDLKNDLSKLNANILKSDLIDGSYVAKVEPWINVNTVSAQQAETVAKQLLQLQSVGIYTANYLPISALNVNIGGFFGTDLDGDESVANMYMLTTRQGYPTGYVVQWKGKPVAIGNQAASSISRVNLLTQVAPNKLNIFSSNNDWLNLTTHKIQNPLKFKKLETDADELEIYKGTFFGQALLPGNDSIYKRFFDISSAPVESELYGGWRQNVESKRFTGQLDIYKTNPITYLDRAIFKTEQNVNSGDRYIFPLYADLIFKFKNTDIPTQTLSIVVDEHGDIRTNKTATNLKSNTCPVIQDTQTMTDALGVKQYRIGTTGTTNSSSNDKSVSIRMILANPIFGNLDGALIGLNQKFESSGVQNIAQAYSSGVRLNLHNLLINNNVNSGINVTSWGNQSDLQARWVNMLAVSQLVYNTAANNQPTQEQQDIAKRIEGTIEVELSPCYSIQTKR